MQGSSKFDIPISRGELVGLGVVSIGQAKEGLRSEEGEGAHFEIWGFEGSLN
jgi:hypothetical protein